MRRPGAVKSLTDLGRVRLSRHFQMREFLHSEVASFHGLPNIPDDPDLAVAAGTRLCEELLEPLNATFGRIVIRSGYRSEAVNGFCNRMQKAGKAGYGCAANEATHAGHIWDRRDAAGRMGAMATVMIPWLADRLAAGGDWRAMAWWVHDHLPYASMQVFPVHGAFNIGWREDPPRLITSFAAPKGKLTGPGMANRDGDHSAFYPGYPPLRRG